MYSKSKGITDRDYSLTPPPGYDGSRFRRRSDGRDDTFPYYREDVIPSPDHQKKCVPKRKRPIHTDQCEPSCDTCESCEPCDTYESCEFPEEEGENCQCCFDGSQVEPDQECQRCEDCEQCPEPSDQKGLKDHGIMSFLQGLGSEEILLIALIVLLAGSKNHDSMDTVLLLALLLCVS